MDINIKRVNRKEFDNRIEYRYAKSVLKELIKKNESRLNKSYGKNGYKFGTIAVRLGNTSSFTTTARGKVELNDLSFVEKVDHRRKKVYAYKKATLNAPLLHKIFTKRKDIKAIVHCHEEKDNCKLFPYSVPGTVRDAFIAEALPSDCNVFCIKGHGTFELLTSQELNP
jgi:hypothetical protein